MLDKFSFLAFKFNKELISVFNKIILSLPTKFINKLPDFTKNVNTILVKIFLMGVNMN